MILDLRRIVSVIAGAQNILLPMLSLNTLTIAKLHVCNIRWSSDMQINSTNCTNRMWRWPEPSGGAVQERVTDVLCSLFV